MPRCPDCNCILVRGYALLVCPACAKHWSDEFMEGFLRGIEDAREIINNFAERMRN